MARAARFRDGEGFILALPLYEGLAYRLIVTVAGLALTLLGSLAVVTFWGNPSGLPKRQRKKA